VHMYNMYLPKDLHKLYNHIQRGINYEGSNSKTRSAKRTRPSPHLIMQSPTRSAKFHIDQKRYYTTARIYILYYKI